MVRGGFFLGLTLVAALPVLADDNNFDRVFNTDNEPRSIHYRAHYRDSSGEHSLELWREADERCLRITDNRLEAWIVHQGQDEDWSLTLLDRLKNTVTRIDRDRLLKRGTVIDWFDLTHGLARPWGAHRVSPTPAPEALPPLMDDCLHYILETASGKTQICWSPRYRLPLSIQPLGQNELIWRVEAIDTTPIDPEFWSRPELLERLSDPSVDSEDED